MKRFSHPDFFSCPSRFSLFYLLSQSNCQIATRYAMEIAAALWRGRPNYKERLQGNISERVWCNANETARQRRAATIRCRTERRRNRVCDPVTLSSSFAPWKMNFRDQLSSERQELVSNNSNEITVHVYRSTFSLSIASRGNFENSQESPGEMKFTGITMVYAPVSATRHADLTFNVSEGHAKEFPRWLRWNNCDDVFPHERARWLSGKNWNEVC